jgi:hypothetical protein
VFEDVKTIAAPADQPLRLWIEPWADEREFPPGTVVTLRASSPQDGHLEIVPAEDATWVYGWVGSTLEVLVGDRRIALFDNPPPALPEGMSMRGFIGGVLGANPQIDDGNDGGGAPSPATSSRQGKRPWWRFWGR